jgi:hypothetical protein
VCRCNWLSVLAAQPQHVLAWSFWYCPVTGCGLCVPFHASSASTLPLNTRPPPHHSAPNNEVPPSAGPTRAPSSTSTNSTAPFPPPLTQLVRFSRSLKKLGLAQNHIGRAGCAALRSAILANPGLQQLQLLPGAFEWDDGCVMQFCPQLLLAGWACGGSAARAPLSSLLPLPLPDPCPGRPPLQPPLACPDAFNG